MPAPLNVHLAPPQSSNGAKDADSIPLKSPFFSSLLGSMAEAGSNGLLIGGVKCGKSKLLEIAQEHYQTEGFGCCVLMKEVPDQELPGFQEQPWLMPFTTLTGETTTVDFHQALSERILGVGTLLVPNSALQQQNQAIGDYLLDTIASARLQRTGVLVQLLVDDASRLFGAGRLKSLYDQAPGEVGVLAAQNFCNEDLASNSLYLVTMKGALPGIMSSSIDHLADKAQSFLDGEARLYTKREGKFKQLSRENLFSR